MNFADKINAAARMGAERLAARQPRRVPDEIPSLMVDRVDYVGEHRRRWRYQPSEGTVYRELTQTNEDLILRRNADLAKDSKLTAGMELHGMRYVGEIPSARWHAWCRQDPRFLSPVKEDRRAAMFRKMITEPDVLTVPRSFLGKKSGESRRATYFRFEG